MLSVFQSGSLVFILSKQCWAAALSACQHHSNGPALQPHLVVKTARRSSTYSICICGVIVCYSFWNKDEMFQQLVLTVRWKRFIFITSDTFEHRSGFHKYHYFSVKLIAYSISQLFMSLCHPVSHVDLFCLANIFIFTCSSSFSTVPVIQTLSCYFSC